MAAQYSINPAELTASAGKVNTQSKEIMDRVADVMREVRGAQRFWTGQASGQYEALMSEWNRTASQVQQALDHTVQALQKAASQYDTTETQNASMFNG